MHHVILNIRNATRAIDLVHSAALRASRDRRLDDMRALSFAEGALELTRSHSREVLALLCDSWFDDSAFASQDIYGNRVTHAIVCNFDDMLGPVEFRG